MRARPLRIAASVVASALIVMIMAAACARRTPGTCGEDIDCAPGHDCKAGVCVQRQRLRFDDGKPARPDPTAGATPAVTEGVAPKSAPGVPGAAAIPDAGAERPARRKGSPAPPSSPSPSPPAVPAPAAPAGREPMWKQRLKNS